MVACSDWVLDIGPEGGEGGGRLVVEGTPETIAACAESHTGRYLVDVLNRTGGTGGKKLTKSSAEP